MEDKLNPYNNITLEQALELLTLLTEKREIVINKKSTRFIFIGACQWNSYFG